MRPNTVRQLWAEDTPAFGAWLGTASPLAAESMAHSGWDWLVVDGEHSPVDLLTMVQMFQAISTTDTIPMARVHWNDPVEIKRILDGGAYGVVIPLGEQPGRGGAGGQRLPLPAGRDAWLRRVSRLPLRRP